MPTDSQDLEDVALLPGWQRLVWIAAVWAGSVAIMVLVTLLVTALIPG